MKRGLPGLLSIRDDWTALLRRRSERIGYFHTPFLYECFLRSHPRWERSIVFGCVYRGDQLAVVLPLTLSRMWVKGVPLRQLRFVSEPEFHTCDAIVADREALDSGLRLICDELLKHRDFRWDVLLLTRVPEDSPLRQAARQVHLPTSEMVDLQTRIIPVRESDVPLKNVSSNLKDKLRRGARDLAKTGPVVHRTTPNDISMSEAFDIFVRLEASGWKGADGGALAQSDENRRFYELLATGKDEHLWARIHVLNCGDRPIAAAYMFECGRVCYYLRPSYDESVSAQSPGHLLLEQILNWAQRSGEFDHVNLLSDADWVHRWTPDVQTLWRVSVYRRTIPGMLALLRHRISKRRRGAS